MFQIKINLLIPLLSIYIIFCLPHISTMEASNNKSKVPYLNYAQQESWKVVAGLSQSPINIITQNAVSMEDNGQISIKYSKNIKKILDNGHNLEIDGDGVVVVNGRIFHFTELHFHTPSDHTLNGNVFPAEAHFVHRSQTGQYAIFAIFFKIGQSNPYIQQICDYLDQNTKKLQLDLRRLIPNRIKYYHYIGSLTTPPLSENVEWYVMQDQLELSEMQLKVISLGYHNNHRKIQPINNRILIKNS